MNSSSGQLKRTVVYQEKGKTLIASFFIITNYSEINIRDAPGSMDSLPTGPIPRLLSSPLKRIVHINVASSLFCLPHFFGCRRSCSRFLPR